MRHALKHPGARYTFDAHQRFHGLSYPTARKDLLDLSKLKLLDKAKTGNKVIFLSPHDLRERVKANRKKR